ncbi:hypothetical protein PQR71_39785 [Paraburkholderia fungorum]
MYGEAFADAFIAMVVVVLIIGILLGGLCFEGIPWLFHHLSIRWN